MAGVNAARRWMEIPCDWRRGPETGPYTLYYNDVSDYGDVQPRPERDEIPAFYAVDYYTHSTGPATRHGLTFGWRLLRHLAWRLDKGVAPSESWWRDTLGDRPMRCLDIGCGDGSNLDLLKSIGHDVTGVEPDPAARATATARGLKVLAGTGEDLPEELAPGSFDCVLMSHVLEHCLDPVAALRSVRKVLTEDGVLVIDVPNNACAGLRHFGRIWYFLDVPRHLNFFTAKSLGSMLKRVGFETRPADHHGYVMQFDTPWIGEQERVRQAFADDRAGTTMASYWRFFFKTMLAAPESKYCCLRMVASPNAAGEPDE